MFVIYRVSFLSLSCFSFKLFPFIWQPVVMVFMFSFLFCVLYRCILIKEFNIFSFYFPSFCFKHKSVWECCVSVPMFVYVFKTPVLWSSKPVMNTIVKILTWKPMCNGRKCYWRPSYYRLLHYCQSISN